MIKLKRKMVNWENKSKKYQNKSLFKLNKKFCENLFIKSKLKRYE